MLNGSGAMGEMMRRMMGVGESMPRMPAFGDKLTRDDVVAILAYIKTWWTDRQRELQGEGDERGVLSMKRCFGLGLAFVAALALATTSCNEAPAALNRPEPYEGTLLDGAAPDFRLVDQNGVAVALSDLRGKVVALAFLDPECTDVCPLTASAFRLTSERLGGDATRVAFLAVNVNSRRSSVADMAGATDKWGISGLQSWHFLTGAADDLEPVWKAYNVEAQGPPKSGKPNELSHTPGVYLIDQAGEKRWYISTAFDPDASLRDLLLKRIRTLLR